MQTKGSHAVIRGALPRLDVCLTASLCWKQCGGERAAVGAAEPYLRLMGKRVHYCGGPGNGQAAKVALHCLSHISSARMFLSFR